MGWKENIKKTINSEKGEVPVVSIDTIHNPNPLPTNGIIHHSCNMGVFGGVYGYNFDTIRKQLSRLIYKVVKRRSTKSKSSIDTKSNSECAIQNEKKQSEKTKSNDA